MNKFAIITESGHLKSPSYAHLLSTGKYHSTFSKNNGLASCLTAMLSSGLVGYANSYCNIGGDSEANKEVKRTQLLLIRWMQLSAFTSVFKADIKLYPQSEQLQVNSNEFLLNNFAFYSQVFTLLKSYKK
jgi:alpha-glucosidase